MGATRNDDDDDNDTNIPAIAIQNASGNVLKHYFTGCMEDLSDCSCCKVMLAKIVRHYSRK